MACYCPMTAYRTRDGITFSRSASLTGEPFDLPCGQCIGCRLEKSRQWAMRCMHEKRLHRVSSFVTLTYDNENLPAGASLNKRDLQLFMKRLRKARGPGVRFYACGEYGDQTMRPHYHAILFGVDFPDRRVWSTAKDRTTYDSQELVELWPSGRNVIGDVTFESAAYVARYCMKKITGDAAADFYTHVDDDGVVTERQPPFTVMSRRPGIGSGYYEQFGHEVRAHDSVVVNAREVRPPRFYDTRTKLFDEDRFDMIRKKRKRQALALKADNTVDRRRVKERLAIETLKQKARPL